MGMTCGDVSKVWSAFPKLTLFSAFGSDIEFGEIVAPELDHLGATIGKLTPEIVGSVVATHAPKLTSLRLGYMDVSLLGALRPILSGKTFPKLVDLQFTATDNADAIAEAVLKSALKLDTFAMWSSELGKPMLAKLRARFGDKFQT